MNKKIIFGIIVLIIISTIVIVILGYWFSPSIVSIQKTDYLVDAITIKIESNELNDFPYLEKGFALAKAYGSVGLDHEENHKSIIQLSNDKVLPLIFFLKKQSESNFLSSQHYLNYNNDLYWIKIYSCFLTCPSFYSEENDLEQINLEKYQYKFWKDEVERVNTHSLWRVFFSYSHDYGQTFSEPKDMSMTENYAAEPKMIVFDNDVILVWRDQFFTYSLLAFAISNDHGETFEKKSLFEGGFPDIVHKNDILYFAWVEYKPFKIFYTKSFDRGETFEESKLIFSPEYDWDPTLNAPKPKFSQDSGILKITWNFILEDYEYVIEE